MSKDEPLSNLEYVKLANKMTKLSGRIPESYRRYFIRALRINSTFCRMTQAKFPIGVDLYNMEYSQLLEWINEWAESKEEFKLNELRGIAEKKSKINKSERLIKVD